MAIRTLLSSLPRHWFCFSANVRILCVRLQDAQLLTSAVHVVVTKASKSAIAAVESLGGSVVSQYDTQLSLRATLKPEKFDVLPKRPSPPPKAIPYYLDDENRGYLSSKVQLEEAKRRLAGSKPVADELQ